MDTTGSAPHELVEAIADWTVAMLGPIWPAAAEA
jgi:hypothetical protein